MIPTRTLGAGSWWANAFGQSRLHGVVPDQFWLVHSDFNVVRYLDGWVVR